MRIISGNLKGIRFQPPKGFSSRPTTDFAKEALFNVLEHRLSLIDLEILDLCAGTGSITIEFASREAGQITAVDTNFKCTKFISEFAIKHDISEAIQVVKSDVIKFLSNTSKTYDLIFADPPFDKTFHKDIIDIVFERELLNEDGLLIMEHGKHTKFTDHPKLSEVRKYSSVVFSFFKNN